MNVDNRRQEPGRFGVGSLFWLTSEAIVGAELTDETIALWNPAAERIFGYTADEAIGMPLEALVPEELRAQHVAGIRRYRNGGDAVLVGMGPVDIPAVTKSGDRRDVALTLTDLSPQSGDARVLAVIRDVTAQRQAERDLGLANQAMREFVATASHDLRSPLAAVEGYAELLAEHGDEIDAAERTEALAVILRSARVASRLVSDLLALSQIQAGVVATHAEVVGVAEAARRAAAAASDQVDVSVDESLAVSVDSHHLERMLVNYLTNAVRYGTPPISVVATDRGSVVEVRVCDRGDGPPAEFTSRLFDSFARATPATGEGTGLGLSIVKGLAEANGGTAFHEHDAELGTCFGLVLPAAVT